MSVCVCVSQVLSVLVVAEHSLGIWGLLLAVPLTVFALDYCIKYPDSSVTEVKCTHTHTHTRTHTHTHAHTRDQSTHIELVLCIHMRTHS